MTTSTTHHMARMVDGAEAPIPGEWLIDPAHTSAEFIARHLMVTKVRGGFAAITGSITVADDPADSRVEVVLDAASVSTGTSDRDAHLRSADFLDVENHPEIRFISTAIEPRGGSWRMTGDLTIKGTTRPVTFDVDFTGIIDDPWGNPKATFAGTTEIDREDWGLTWNVALETGGVLVSKKVTIEIEVQATPAA